jgi:hypothetical protein
MLAHEFPLEPHTEPFNRLRHTGLFPNPTPLLMPTCQRYPYHWDIRRKTPHGAIVASICDDTP